MNTVGRFDKRLASPPTGRGAGPVARGARMAAVCAGLAMGLASCTNGYSGGLSLGGVYGGSRYDPYYGPYSRYDRGPAFSYGNPLYAPFYDDDWPVRKRHKHKTWRNGLSDEETARIKAHDKELEPEERFPTQSQIQHGPKLDDADAPPPRANLMGNPQKRDLQEQPDEPDSARVLWNPQKSR